MFQNNITKDTTLIKKTEKDWLRLFDEYNLIKQHKHPIFRFVKDFYAYNKICGQNFSKYFNRFKQSGDTSLLLPQKRGPKWGNRRPSLHIELDILTEREKGLNKFEIYQILKNTYKDLTPSTSTIYRLLVKNKKNRLTVKMKEEKQKIISKMPGELGHCDCYQLPTGIIDNEKKKRYLIAIIDDYDRVAWCTDMDDVTSMSAMFGTMRCLNALNSRYYIEFVRMMTDNGPEFGNGSKNEKVIMTNPFKRLLHELNIKHTFTKPYKPQTNGKVERFWRTIKDDLLEGTTFSTVEEFRKELYKYMIYYNEYRPHQGINGKIPANYCKEFYKNENKN
jgi:transposase InsO family protein